MQPNTYPTKSQPVTHWRTRTALILSGGLLALSVALGLWPTPAAAQSTIDQAAITELLQSAIALQEQVLRTGDYDLLAQHHTLLDQVRSLRTAIETGGPFPDLDGNTTIEVGDGTTETSINNPDDPNHATTPIRDDSEESATATRVTECPDLTVTRQQLRDYVAAADDSAGTDSGLVIPPAIECLGEAVLQECATAMTRHEAGYTFYITAGETAQPDSLYGNQRCYLSLSRTDEPEEAVRCSLASIADRGWEEDPDEYTANDLESFLQVTLPEFVADHAFPLDTTYSGYSSGLGGRSVSSAEPLPLDRLESQMECTYRAVNLEPEETT